MKIILWHVNFLFCLAKTNNTLILPNISLKLILSKCSSFSHWHLIAMFGGCVFPDGTYGYKLGSSSHWLVPFFVRGIIHTEASQEKRKEASLILWCYIPVYSWCTFTTLLLTWWFVNRIYPTEVEIKDTTGTARFTSYFDLHLAIDSNCQLRTKLCPFWPFQLCVATFQKHLHVEYIFLSWSEITECVVPFRI